jgi:surface protein
MFDPITLAFAKKLSGGGSGGGEDEWYITDASYLFHGGARLDVMDFLIPKFKSVTSMNNMFNNCYHMTSVDLSSFDTSKVTNMSNMFNNCQNLISVDVSNFDTSKVTTMSYMFGYDAKLAEITGFSATNKAGVSIGFPTGTASSRYALKRLTFRTDLPNGVYSIRSAIKISYCSFDRDGMVEMFNTLPDVSGLGLSSSYTTITITGNPCVTDATLTAEDEAIATSKGWTLVK